MNREIKVKNDIESLLDNADTKTKENIEFINRLRQDAIDDLEQTNTPPYAVGPP